MTRLHLTSSRLGAHPEGRPGGSERPPRGLRPRAAVPGVALAGLLALACLPAPALAATPAARPAPVHRARSRAALDTRVALMAGELGLSAAQQAGLRRILLAQREQVMRAWGDASVAPADRIAATRAIRDATADRIRALLTEAQRAKYFPPRRTQDPAGSGPGVEAWMRASGPR